MGEWGHGRVEAWGSCGIGCYRVGELLSGGVAVWENWGVVELQCAGIVVGGVAGHCGVWELQCVGVAVVTKP